MKKLCLFLALFMLLPIIASCGNNPDDTAVITPSDSAADAAGDAETAAAEAVPNYLTLNENWNGRTFRVLTTDCPAYQQFTNFEVYAEAENGEVVNDAVYRRNTIIEDKHNVKIKDVVIEGTNSTPTEAFNTLKSSCLSDDDICDTFFMALRCVGTVITSGYSVDMYKLPYIDFDESYWNQATNRSMEIAGKLLMTNSDFSLLDKKRTYILIYNRDLVSTYTSEVLEDHVHNGTWTYGKLMEVCENMSVDLDGNGKIDNNDQWAIGMDSYNGVTALMLGMNAHITDKDSDGNIIYTALDEHTVNVMQLLYDTLNGTNVAYYCRQYPNWKRNGYTADEDSSVSFKEGKTAFVTLFPQSLPQFSAACEFDYGVIAWPKYNDAQEDYYTFADSWGFSLFGVPITAPDTAFSGFMLEVLSGYSTDTSYNAYLEVACKVKYVYDETSAEMLDLCFKNITFELVSIFNWKDVYSGLMADILDGKSFKYVSKVSSKQIAVEGAIAETMEFVLGNAS